MKRLLILLSIIMGIVILAGSYFKEDDKIKIPAKVADDILGEYINQHPNLIKDLDVVELGVKEDYLNHKNDILEIGVENLTYYKAYKIKRFVEVATNGEVNLNIIEGERAVAQ